jgi:predicted RND superfamily exporter protein
MKKVKYALGAFAVRCHRRPLLSLGLALVLGVAAALQARGLSLNANLVDLLPESFQSVQDVHKLEKRFGGVGWVVVVGEGGTPEQLRRFADRIAPELEALPSIEFVEHERPGRFFEERWLYFLDLRDLQEIERRLKARAKWERNRNNPLFIQFEDVPAPSLDFSDIAEKYGHTAEQRFIGNGESHYLDPSARRVVIMAKPRGYSSDLGFADRVVRDVEALLERQDLSRYGPSFQVAVTGSFKKKVDQHQQIARDISAASTLAAVAVLAYLVFHFRSLLAVALCLSPVAVGLAWTYGIAALLFGTVNLLTGFLGAILGGLGIEHGMHLLGRYLNLRRNGSDSEAATRDAFTRTGGSALISAAVGALTFLSIAISEFRAFREFGFIAAIGMLLLLAAYVLVLPPLLGLASRTSWSPRRIPHVDARNSPVARWLPGSRWPVALLSSAMLFGLVGNCPNVRFNYDLAALEDSSLPSFVLDKQVNRILGYSQTPVAVLTDSPADERAVVNELSERMSELGTRSSIDFVAAIDEAVPGRQAEKQPLLESIGAVLARVDPARLDPSLRERFRKLQRQVKARPFTRDDLPRTFRRQFQGNDPEGSGFVLVFPSVSMADGARIREFAREVRGISLPRGGTLSAAGEAMVLADIIDMVAEEGPPIVIVALLAVLLAMWLTLGNLQHAIVCMSPTILSIMALIGLMPMTGQEFNYLNILIIVVLIGTTVDAGVHLLSLLRDRREPFDQVFGETGRAIVGGLLTSVVGFAALEVAHHPGLNTIGRLANLGFALNLLVMLLTFPAFLLVLEYVSEVRRETCEELRHGL